MSQATREHKAEAPQSLACAVITVSDTRTLETDTGGGLIVSLLETAGHHVVGREILPDEPQRMRPVLERLRDDASVEVVLMTGGTGISPRDQTFETVSGLLTRQLPGYGELFRMLSYEQIGAAAMLSRATGGLMESTVLLTMPGSRAAVQLAMESVILPELPHLVGESRKGG